MYVVAGVTGNTGSAVAESLLSKKAPVRVLVRRHEQGARWKAKGADVAVVNLDDALALSNALRGAKGAYLLLPHDPRCEDILGDDQRRADRLARAVAMSGIPHTVFLSSIGAHQPQGTGVVQTLHTAEGLLGGLGRAMTFVRAAYFVENWAPVLPTAKAQGVLPSFVPPELAIPMVAVRDIGRVAAGALLDGPRGRRIIELGGPVDASPNDVAATLTDLLGKPVTVAAAPLDAVVPTFTSFGLSQDLASLFRGLYAGIIDGTVAWQDHGTERVRGQVDLRQALAPLVR
jgi:uncharacterized protein YbjT (DUF2867 family)